MGIKTYLCKLKTSQSFNTWKPWCGSLELCCFILQVERRVVTQLAMAHERQLIDKGCKIKLTVRNADDLTKSHDDTSSNEPKERTIRLQLLKKGERRYKDIDLKSDENPFTFGFK